MDRSLLVFRASYLMLLISMLMLLTGVFNAAFKGTPFAGWKQFLVVIAFMLATHLARRDCFLRRLLLFTLWGSVLLIVSSFMQGFSSKAIFYNIFFYISWIPFFVWAVLGGSEQFQKQDKMIAIYLIIAAIGLVVDLKTDFFSFLNIRNEIVTIDYLMMHEIAGRAVFIFTASNLVMIVIAPLIILFLMYKHTMIRLILCLAVIGVVILTTASLNGVMLAMFVILGVLYSNARVSIKTVYFIVFMSLIFLMFNFNLINLESIFGGQIDRLFGNTSITSEANNGRFWFWKRSLSDIGNFSIFQHFLGAGLGCTNANYNTMVLYTHGESSYLQAYTEGGIIGLLFRLMPFILLFYFVIGCKDRRKFMILGYGVGIFMVYGLAPLFGNVLSQMLLGMLIGNIYALRKSERNENCKIENIDALKVDTYDK